MKLGHWVLFASLSVLQVISSYKAFASQPIPEELVGYDIVHDFSTGSQQTTRSGAIAPVPTNPDQKQYLDNLSKFDINCVNNIHVDRSGGGVSIIVKPTSLEDQIISNTQINFSLSCPSSCAYNNPSINQISCELSTVTYNWVCKVLVMPTSFNSDITAFCASQLTGGLENNFGLYNL